MQTQTVAAERNLSVGFYIFCHNVFAEFQQSYLQMNWKTNWIYMHLCFFCQSSPLILSQTWSDTSTNHTAHKNNNEAIPEDENEL